MITPFVICVNFGDLQIFLHRKVWSSSIPTAPAHFRFEKFVSHPK